MSLLDACAHGYYFCEGCGRIPDHVQEREVAGQEIRTCRRGHPVKWFPPIGDPDLVSECDCCHHNFPLRELRATGLQFLCAKCAQA